MYNARGGWQIQVEGKEEERERRSGASILAVKVGGMEFHNKDGILY